MNKPRLMKLWLFLMLFTLMIFAPNTVNADDRTNENVQPDSVDSTSNDSFLENLGQFGHTDVKYYCEVAGGYIGLCSNRISFWSRNMVRTDLLKFEPNEEILIEPESQLSSITNYYLGNRGTFTGVRSFSSINYNEIIPNVCLSISYSPQGLACELKVGETIDVSKLDELVLNLEGFTNVERKLDSYENNKDILFMLEDETLEQIQMQQVTTPHLSRFLGGSGNDHANGIARDSAGNLYVAGYSFSSNFPLVNQLYDYQGAVDAFITMLDSTGAIVYSTYIGGNETSLTPYTADDYAEDITVDDSGNVYVTGYTRSDDFPTLNPLYSFEYNSTILRGGYNAYEGDVFVVRLNSSGLLDYSTYLGAFEGEIGRSIAVDNNGNMYIGGQTSSTDFPTANAFDDIHEGIGTHDGFVTCLSATGDDILFSSYIGGTSDEDVKDITIDAEGNILVTGYTYGSFVLTNALYTVPSGDSDAFVMKINSTSWTVIYATYIGGDERDIGMSISTDNDGNAYVTGKTQSSEHGNIRYPIVEVNAYDSTHNGGDDCFLSVISDDGNELLYSSFIGGSGSDEGNSVVVDENGIVFIAGTTSSSDFPVTVSSGMYNGLQDAFVLKMNIDQLLDSRYVGGTESDQVMAMTVDSSNTTYVCGFTRSNDFPSTGQSTYAGGDEGFLFGYQLAYTQPNTGGNDNGLPVPLIFTTALIGGLAIISGFGVFQLFVRFYRRREYEVGMESGPEPLWNHPSDNPDIGTSMSRDPLWNHPSDNPDVSPRPPGPEPLWNHPSDNPDGFRRTGPEPLWNHPSDNPDGLPKPSQKPLWNHPSDNPDGSGAPKTPEPLWNHPSDNPDGLPEPVQDPLWNHPSDNPDGMPPLSRDPLWNHPSDNPDGLPELRRTPQWNHPSDNPDGIPVGPEPEPLWNHPSDNPDGFRRPSPEPLWNHPSDNPDGLPEPSVDPLWNHPSDNPDGIPSRQTPEPLWNHPSDNPDILTGRIPSTDVTSTYTPGPLTGAPTDHPKDCDCPLCKPEG